MVEKFGLRDEGDERSFSEILNDDKEVKQMKDQFWSIMQEHGSDFTNTFRALSQITKSEDITA